MPTAITLVGVDVAAKTLEVCLEGPGGHQKAFEIANDSNGHKDLIKRLTRRRGQARVVLEASGVYHLELAVALDKADGIEVMVISPRVARDFARASMQRSKTDALDAAVLLEYLRRMPFRAWVSPTPQELELRAVGRRITSLTKIRSQEKNRLHASKRLGVEVVCHDIELNIRHLQRRIVKLEGKALDLIWKSPRLRKQLVRLTSIRGVGKTSAIRILAELCVLPKDMTPRQWVALAGLDPRIFQSGTSLDLQARISKMGNRALRAALFMPALVASRHEPHVKAFYDMLIGRQKAPLQAIVAIMRKLLHSIHGMLRTDTDFDGAKFYALRRIA
ncbi:MAG: IS110 family transposase [bacterium]|nr:IS110 family transposase [bacterium]